MKRFYKILTPLVILSLIIFVMPKEASAASIAFDATSVSASVTTSPITWTHTVGAGTNTFLVVGSALFANSGFAAATAVTYNGVSMTKIRADQFSVSVSREVELSIWVLKNPTAGANTVSITYTASAGLNTADYGFAMSYTGVQQANTVDGQVATSAITTTIGAVPFTLTTTQANDWYSSFCATFSGNSAIVCTSSKTNRSSAAYVGSGQAKADSADSNSAFAAGNQTVQFSTSPSLSGYLMSAVGLTPAPVPVNHSFAYIKSAKAFILTRGYND